MGCFFAQVRIAAKGWLNDEAARRLDVHPKLLGEWLKGTILPIHAGGVDEHVRLFLRTTYN